MLLSSAVLSLSIISLLQASPVSARAAADVHSIQRRDASTDDKPPSIDEILKRNAAIEEKLEQQRIVGVRKMSDDEGEKFFLDYWYFADEPDEIELGNVTEHGRRSDDIEDLVRPGLSWKDVDKASALWANGSAFLPFRPPFPLHGDEQIVPLRLLRRYLGASGVLSPLVKRGFQCPAGTHSCSSINRPNSCCGTGETCQLVEDTGLGDVGCCPQGHSCSGGVTACEKGYSSCPSNLGGGCCIPGYKCVEDGCAFVSTLTVTVHPPVTTSTPSSTSPSPTPTPSLTSATLTTATLVPPARPTSLSTVTTQERTSMLSVCPTGFYACSAVYQGGCCRTGRDCDTTSCPAMSSTTITSEGRTIAIPVEPTVTDSGTVTRTGRCASGWFSCADTVGGGCCPTGFACGTSCTATGSATGTVDKAQPGTGGAMRVEVNSMLMRVYALVAMCWFLWKL